MTPFALPILYYLFLLALIAFLLVRGLTHRFLLVFMAGALIELFVQLGFVVLTRLPGGASANARWFPALSFAGTIGMLLFALGFGMLAAFLLRRPQAPNS